MMAFNSNIHHRRSIRLQDYDYSQAGFYFVTIVCQNRQHLLGEIENDQMMLNDAGKMIGSWYVELPKKFIDIKCHAITIMPNHIHFIIENIGSPANSEMDEYPVGADLRVCPERYVRPEPNGSNTNPVGADLRVCPERYVSPKPNGSNTDPVGADLRVCPERYACPKRYVRPEPNDSKTGEHIGSPLPRVVQWFKTMTTNAYIRGVKNDNWQRFDGKLWQRNYWEHVIRNESEYHRITQYIIDNPLKWGNDKLNGGQGNVVMEPETGYNTESWMI